MQDRKQILQQLKKHIEAMCKDGDAQLVLFTAFDCVEYAFLAILLTLS
jgi:pumilio family protein 6